MIPKSLIRVAKRLVKGQAGRPGIAGIYLAGKKATTTNGHALVQVDVEDELPAGRLDPSILAVKDTEVHELRDGVLQARQGAALTEHEDNGEKYPDLSGIIPDPDGRLAVQFNVQVLRDALEVFDDRVTIYLDPAKPVDVALFLGKVGDQDARAVAMPLRFT